MVDMLGSAMLLNQWKVPLASATLEKHNFAANASFPKPLQPHKIPSLATAKEKSSSGFSSFDESSPKRHVNRRTDERYKTMPISFEEITEVDEESQLECNTGSASDDRSPYSLDSRDWMRNNNNNNLNKHYNPIGLHRFHSRSVPKLNRPSFDHSGPLKRKRSTTGGSLEQLNLNLPPIPEATSPHSPLPQCMEYPQNEDEFEVEEVEEVEDEDEKAEKISVASSLGSNCSYQSSIGPKDQQYYGNDHNSGSFFVSTTNQNSLQQQEVNWHLQQQQSFPPYVISEEMSEHFVTDRRLSQ